MMDGIEYPPDLPISSRRGEVSAALMAGQVVIVCGDTGSGKTTQLPKIALELGFGAHGRRIAVTQPRRMAAVAMAERVAAELHSELGGLVGYQHRYAKAVSDLTRIKFMTDGVLLSETRSDPLLRAYDVIMIDEAHERSLNVDFLLGILKRILERRRDLKVIVSSATLDTSGFSRFFGDAPVVSVPGRMYPVDVLYRPSPDEDDADLAGDVADAVVSLPRDGDVLVFLPGERDIRETADRLKGRIGQSDDVIPLMASLPAGEQRRAFTISTRRRVILSTNVAETSVTLPCIRYVVDSGLARLSRYSHRTQVQRLQIEPVSQASARQRAGRCGRIGPGVCIRLYSEEDFASREQFTPPEILRSSLAGVLLAMMDLRLGDISSFPFIDPPRPAAVKEGMNELLELGAVDVCADGTVRLTDIGRKLARIPVEPRLARIMLAASRLATLPSVLPVVASLECDDPRRRPADEREKARAAHAKWRVAGSDFIGSLKLWNWWLSETADLSQAKARKLCRDNYLSYPKMREWRDLVRQLEELSVRMGLDVKSDNGGQDAFHRAMLSGLLSRIGKFDPEEREYRGAHGVRFAIHPGSALAKKPADWVVAGSLVETSRLFARDVAGIDVQWLEPVAGTLCRRSYREPTWEAETGFVRAIEQVVLFGLVIVPSRRCDFSRINPAEARRIFIRFGLVECEFPHPPREVRENMSVIAELRRRAEKLRRPDLFDSVSLEAFFDGVVPQGVCSANALRKWLSRASVGERAAFRLDRAKWLATVKSASADYPDVVVVGGERLSLSYRHSPDDPEEDGITCTVLASKASVLAQWRAEWLVPGMLAAKISWMLASLPSALRRVLAPLDEKTSVLLSRLRFGDGSLEDAVCHIVYSEWGFKIPADAWNSLVPPPHLRVRYRVVDDESRKPVVVSRSLREVVDVLNGSSQESPHVEWDFGDLPDDGLSALHDEGVGVLVRLYADRATAERKHSNGVARLFCLALDAKAKRLVMVKNLPLSASLFLREIGYEESRIKSDLLEGAVREAMVRGRPPVRTAAVFAERLKSAAADFARIHAEMSTLVSSAIADAGEVNAALEGGGLPECAVDSVLAQLAWLVHPGFPAEVPLERLRRYARYLKGASLRLVRAKFNPAGDRAKESRFAPYWSRYCEAVRPGAKTTEDPASLAEYRWLLEEYRISLFAPELKTFEKASPQRLDELWDAAVRKP